jgi:RNA methyltransferase, TrmH family
MIGRGHPALRRVRELRKDRRVRDAKGVFVAEGLHLAGEALRAGADVETAVVSPRLVASEEGRTLRRELERLGVPLLETTDAVLTSLSDARSPQPLLLLIRARLLTPDQAIEGRGTPAFLAVLHGVQDPGNLGSVLRTADAASATGLVVVGEGADLRHPRAVRATAGSIFRLPAAACRGEDLLPRLRERGIRFIGADPRSRTDFASVDMRGPIAVFLGGEGAGLPREWLAAMDHRVRIPMHPGVESLSIGAAAAVLLFEVSRQRAGEGGPVSSGG